jgi:[ribosomal protein S5]-alanine N-acetyltransferase
MISTKRFLLRPLVENDATERYLSWLDDADAKKYITVAEKTKCLSDLKQYVRDRIDRGDILFLGIFDKNTGLHIGNIKYEPVNSELGYAIMGLLIGDPAYRGKGVAAEILSASGQWLKEHKKIKQILLGVSTDNAAAISVYEKVGFEISDTELIRRKPNALSMVLDLEKLVDR